MRTILLVEDDQIYARFVCSAIGNAKLPYTVNHVASPDAALVLLKGGAPSTPSIVLLDLRLASLSGFPVLAWLHDAGRLKDTHVIVLTASDNAQDISQALKLGASSYLIKSPTASNLVDLLGKFALESP